MAFKLENISRPKTSDTKVKSDFVSCSLLLEKFLYKDLDSGFFITSCKNIDKNKTIVFDGKIFDAKKISVVGNSAAFIDYIKEGQEISVSGILSFNKKYESLQIEMDSFTELLPTGKNAIQSLLSSGRISGVGIATARKIVQKFGTKTIDILNNKIELLLDVDGISPKKFETIKNSWFLWKDSFAIIVELRSLGFNESSCYRIYNVYKEQTREVLKSNPYQLVGLDSVSFKEIDKYALSSGYTLNSPERITAYILDSLESVISTGDTAYPSVALSRHVVDELGINISDFTNVINELIGSKLVYTKNIIIDDVIIESYVCSKYYGIEFSIAKMLTSINHHIDVLNSSPIEIDLSALDESQSQAIKNIIASKVSILTGGPGTGKTYTIKFLLDTLLKNGIRRDRIVLCAPTGRAAKRINEVTGFKSQTIHRLLGSSGGSFLHNDKNKIKADFIIVDESSMIDIFLAFSLLRAIDINTKVLFVGDPNQLPAIGGGDFFKDIINSEIFNVNRLKTIHRQKKGSSIISVSHEILTNRTPSLNEDVEDFIFYQVKNNEDILNKMKDSYMSLLSEGLSPNDIQIITPRKDTILGVKSLNQTVLDIINEDKIIDKYNSVRGFSKGDKVMYLKNDSEIDVYNGDIGTVLEVDTEDQQVLVDFYDNQVLIEQVNLNNLTHSYSITIHKSQGSDFKCLIIPITKSHTHMWTKSLLYTAITRGKEKVILVGDTEIFNKAIKTNKAENKLTNLKDFLIYENNKAISLH